MPEPKRRKDDSKKTTADMVHAVVVWGMIIGFCLVSYACSTFRWGVG